MSKILECSSKGDKRFSALSAKVNVNIKGFNRFDTIDAHYQDAKEFIDESGHFVKARDWREAKAWQKEGRKPVRVNIRGIILPIDFLTYYYKLLWMKYLDTNPQLVEYAKQFDDYSDMFRGKSKNCQADVIGQYMKEGKQSILKECQPFLLALRGIFAQEIIGDLLEAKELVIGHQVNCFGIMGGGLALQIKEKYPIVFDDYALLCKINQKGRSLMGFCQMVEVSDDSVYSSLFSDFNPKIIRIVANLFGQHGIGTDQKRTEEPFLQKALEVMKQTAMEKGYSVALPYQLGSNLGGGNWQEIEKIIKSVFCDYPVTIYRLPER
ncbi:macro domain-containing protein (plasmid) [Brevibacillus halotolerans]|nr:macro domain-containing protein [Brevibacillus halotolerans]